MGRVYKDLKVPLSQLQDFAFNQLVPQITSLSIEDLAEPRNGYVPYKYGDLTDSIFKASNPLEGIIGHATPYVLPLYFEGSLTGQKRWTEEYWDDHSDDNTQKVVDKFKFK